MKIEFVTCEILMQQDLIFTLRRMRTKQNYKTIFQDYQRNLQPIGVALLKRKVRDGYPFILEESEEAYQAIFTYEVWEVDFVSLTPLGESIIHEIHDKKVKIRKIKTVGLSAALQPSLKPRSKAYRRRDSFLKIHGIEIF